MIVGHIGSGSAEIDTGDIEHSLRFSAVRSTRLSKTSFNTSATATYFAAVKRGRLGVISPIFDTNIRFNANDTITAFGLTTTAVFRDPSAFLLIVVGNGELRINGVSYGSVTTSAITGLRIGFDGTNYFDGYMARLGVVDTIASAYTNFGYLNAETGEWVTKSQGAVKAVVDAGGTNSFFLDFDDGTSLTTLGYDKSIHGNHWTLNNHSLTTGQDYDWMEDVPGNSYAVLNPLAKSSAVTTSSGNLVATSSTYPQTIFGTIPIPSTGKFYCELICSTATNSNVGIGFGVSHPGMPVTADYNAPGSYRFYSSAGAYVINNGTVISVSGYTNTAGIPFKIFVDVDAEKVWLGQGTVWWDSAGGTTGDPDTGANPTFSINAVGFNIFAHFNTAFSFSWTINFGQQPFTYTPPTGFKALCQRELDAAGIVTIFGTFTGNAVVDGPLVQMNGSPNMLTINGNAVTFGTHADRLANGFKVRTNSASYNAAGSNTWTATISSDLQNLFKYNNAKDNS